MMQYYVEFSSIESMQHYSIYINIRTGYYEIESMHGIIKISGYSLGDLNGCNYKQINNYAYNCIDEFLKLNRAWCL